MIVYPLQNLSVVILDAFRKAPLDALGGLHISTDVVVDGVDDESVLVLHRLREHLASVAVLLVVVIDLILFLAGELVKKALLADCSITCVHN